MSRPVPRPDVCSVYYTLANKVDVHNQGRQDLIHLETSWPTRNCWFRNLCTGIGMVAENSHRHHNNMWHVKVNHDRFLRRLSYQLATVSELKRADGSVVKRPQRPAAAATSPTSPVNMSAAASAALSRPVSPELMTFDNCQHTVGQLKGRCRWCSNLYGKESRVTTGCVECKVPLCMSHAVGRKCFEQHKVHGLPEKKLASMGESARTRWGHIMAEDTSSTKAHPNQAAMVRAAKKRKQTPH